MAISGLSSFVRIREAHLTQSTYGDCRPHALTLRHIIHFRRNSSQDLQLPGFLVNPVLRLQPIRGEPWKIQNDALKSPSSIRDFCRYGIAGTFRKNVPETKILTNSCDIFAEMELFVKTIFLQRFFLKTLITVKTAIPGASSAVATGQKCWGWAFWRGILAFTRFLP